MGCVGLAKVTQQPHPSAVGRFGQGQERIKHFYIDNGQARAVINYIKDFGRWGLYTFNISGTTLRLNSPANYEYKPTLSVRVRATDNGTGALFYEEPFTISVTDLQEPPPERPCSPKEIAWP